MKNISSANKETTLNIHFLMTTALFRGLTESEIKKVLPCLKAVQKSVQKDEFIYRVGDHIHTLGVLLAGKLSIENDDLWGNKTILNMITPGNIFAETYACIPGAQLMVNVVAVEDSALLYLDITHLLETCANSCTFHHKLIRNLLTISAQKNLNLSRRSFHTSAKTIRARLLSYLSYESSMQGSYEFDIPLTDNSLPIILVLTEVRYPMSLAKWQRTGIFW